MRIRSLALIDDSIHKKKMDIQVKTGYTSENRLRTLKRLQKG